MIIKVGNIVFSEWKQFGANWWRTHQLTPHLNIDVNYFGILSLGSTFRVDYIDDNNVSNSFVRTLHQQYINFYENKTYSFNKLDELKNNVDKFLIKMNKLMILT